MRGSGVLLLGYLSHIKHRSYSKQLRTLRSRELGTSPIKQVPARPPQIRSDSSRDLTFNEIVPCVRVCVCVKKRWGFPKCECAFLERLFHVVAEVAVQFCVILMNDCQFCCACVFLRLFVFALWIFWEKKKNHLHIWCFSVPLTHGHTSHKHNDPPTPTPPPRPWVMKHLTQKSV